MAEGEIRGVILVKLEAADGTAVEPVVGFVYLGSNITRERGLEWPVQHRCGVVEGFIYRCLRRVTRIERGSPDPLEDHPSHAEVFDVAASPHAEEMVREKRLHSMGHCLCMKEDPL